MQSDPLLEANKELEWAWESAHDLSRAQIAGAADRAWRTTLGHLEKLWTKVGHTCSTFGSRFDNWNGKYVKERRADPLLSYLLHARNADHHSGQIVSDLVGHVFGTFEPLTIQFVAPELVATPVVDRNVTYPVPDTHLGVPLGGRHPLVLAAAGCNYYSSYLRAAESEFFGVRPNSSFKPKPLRGSA